MTKRTCWNCGCQRKTHPIPECNQFVDPMTKGDWTDNEPDDMSNPLHNLRWALDQMLDAIDEDRYRYDPVHVTADLRYLRAETRRAIRLATPADVEADQ